MTKKNLNIDFKYDYDFILIGICSALKDYQICYKINKDLNTFLFRSNTDMEMAFNQGNQKARFSLYEYWNNQYETQWYLLANKTKISCKPITNKVKTIFDEIEKESIVIKYLIPEHQKIDYYLQIHGVFSLDRKKKLINDLKSISQVVSAYEISSASLKSKENLIVR